MPNRRRFGSKGIIHKWNQEHIIQIFTDARNNVFLVLKIVNVKRTNAVSRQQAISSSLTSRSSLFETKLVKEFAFSRNTGFQGNKVPITYFKRY